MFNITYLDINREISSKIHGTLKWRREAAGEQRRMKTQPE